MMTFVEVAADVNAKRRIKQETAGKTTESASLGVTVCTLYGLSQILDSSAAVCEMSHTGN